MDQSLFFRTDATILCLILFAGCVFVVRFGRYVRNKFFQQDQQESKGGVNSLLGALFGLWGFILAFTFGNSATRFDQVRTMMIDESSMIRNVVLRSEIFPDSIGNDFRADLKNYLQARIDYYNYASDIDKFNKAKEDTRVIGKSLWEKTLHASTLPNMGITAANMFAALTAMYDVAAKRDALLSSGVPNLVMYLLFFLALVISFIGGFTTPVIGTKEWVIISGFILLACIIIYITLDLSRPMRGFIKPDVGQDRIEQLQKMF
jgi:hypothetical protein